MRSALLTVASLSGRLPRSVPGRRAHRLAQGRPRNAWTQLSDGAGRAAARVRRRSGWPTRTCHVGAFMSEKRKKARPGHDDLRRAQVGRAAGQHPPGLDRRHVGEPKATSTARIKKVLYVRQEWSYSRKRPAAAGW